MCNILGDTATYSCLHKKNDWMGQSLQHPVGRDTNEPLVMQLTCF